MRSSNQHHGPVEKRSEVSGGEFPDDALTTHSHAGQGLEDGYNFPGVILCAMESSRWDCV